jgi:hypothetical protein
LGQSEKVQLINSEKVGLFILYQINKKIKHNFKECSMIFIFLSSTNFTYPWPGEILYQPQLMIKLNWSLLTLLLKKIVKYKYFGFKCKICIHSSHVIITSMFLD